MPLLSTLVPQGREGSRGRGAAAHRLLSPGKGSLLRFAKEVFGCKIEMNLKRNSLFFLDLNKNTE